MQGYPNDYIGIEALCQGILVMSAAPSNSQFAHMFRPPVNHAMKILDRSFFQKEIPLAAARVLENKQISRLRGDLHNDILNQERVSVIKNDPIKHGFKSLLLRPDIRADDDSTWSEKLRKLVDARQVDITPFNLHLDYDYWNYYDIMSAILPIDEQDEIPSGFTIVGHVAHLNLREQYLPYKSIIASVILDKNPTIRTVINKTSDVGTESVFRTFPFELLAGDPDLNVEVRDEQCTFHFDYSKVYWNSRLNTEHRRLVEKFQPGDAVCDVMAGVGPFAVPAGKKKVFAWANDLNPESYASLGGNVKNNKVSQFVRPFNQDGNSFIRSSARELLQTEFSVDITPKLPRLSPNPIPPKEVLRLPRTFAHYILNLPASAITFLPSFIGLYANQEHLFPPHTSTKLPMVHVYCFSTKSETNEEEKIKICREISTQLGHDITPGDEELEIWDVRDVAPMKRMFCASFRLPAEVAFRTT